MQNNITVHSFSRCHMWQAPPSPLPCGLNVVPSIIIKANSEKQTIFSKAKPYNKSDYDHKHV